MGRISIALDRDLVDDLQCTAKQQGTDLDSLLRDLWRRHRAQVQQEKIHVEMEAFQKLHAQLLPVYRGQYVAIHNGQMIDHDFDRLALYRRIRTHYGKTAVLITPVIDQPIEELQLVSFHMERVRQ